MKKHTGVKTVVLYMLSGGVLFGFAALVYNWRLDHPRESIWSEMTDHVSHEKR